MSSVDDADERGDARRRRAGSALSIIAWMASAPSGRAGSRTCAKISPRAASSPKKNPAIAMARIRIGASENTV